ncbi:hypothetical protein TYRP_012557 [Tyrophagus putrescentiae]|nr:hypothetical protein TYRP_012557 [Tyrophagus putrescentiae]
MAVEGELQLRLLSLQYNATLNAPHYSVAGSIWKAMIGEQILQDKSTVTLSTEKHMDGSKKPAGNFSFVKKRFTQRSMVKAVMMAVLKVLLVVVVMVEGGSTSRQPVDCRSSASTSKRQCEEEGVASDSSSSIQATSRWALWPALSELQTALTLAAMLPAGTMAEVCCRQRRTN